MTTNGPSLAFHDIELCGGVLLELDLGLDYNAIFPGEHGPYCIPFVALASIALLETCFQVTRHALNLPNASCSLVVTSVSSDQTYSTHACGGTANKTANAEYHDIPRGQSFV